MAAALKAARELGPDDVVVVVLLPDGGRGYLGKIFNDKWMRSLRLPAAPSEDRPSPTSCAPRPAELPDLVHVHPSDTVRDAIDIMREYDVSQLPVLTAEPPVVMGEVVGSIDERDLLDAVFAGRAHLHDPLERHMAPPLPMIGAGEPVAEAVALLARPTPRWCSSTASRPASSPARTC